MKKIIIFGLVILILIGTTMSSSEDVLEFGYAEFVMNLFAGEEEPVAGFIGKGGTRWVFDIIEEDLDVEMDIEEINLTTIEINLLAINESNMPGSYKWDMALCNVEGVDTLQYIEEDNQGGFENSYPENVNYGLLENEGMNSSWCNVTDGYGYS
ncbi:hypothetical protein LCGC14_2542960, partial [marine sediment metagenome]